MFFVALLLAACGEEDNDPIEQIISENYQLPLNGTLRVRDPEGSIQIYCADHPGLQMVATKRAYSAERLTAIQIRVTASDNAVLIDTIFPPQKKWSWADRSGIVNYNLVIPWDAHIENLEITNGEISVKGLRNGSARARLTNGRIAGRNCFGPLDFRVVNGNIDFFYDWWEKKSYPVRAAIANGGVGLFPPKIASFRLQAHMPNGKILSNFIAKNKINGRSKELKTIVGSDPGPTFEIAGESGNIRIDGY